MNGGQAAVTLSDQQFVMKPLSCKTVLRQHTLDCTQVHRIRMGDLLRTVCTSPNGMHAHMPRQSYKRVNDQTNPEMTGGTELIA